VLTACRVLPFLNELELWDMAMLLQLKHLWNAFVLQHLF
jgi:hypothetical protein